MPTGACSPGGTRHHTVTKHIEYFIVGLLLRLPFYVYRT
nr:MAG TPA: hypothetical protein [Caudoviricetes sp.]